MFFLTKGWKRFLTKGWKHWKFFLTKGWKHWKFFLTPEKLMTLFLQETNHN